MFKKILAVILLISISITPLIFNTKKQSYAYQEKKSSYISLNSNNFTQKDDFKKAYPTNENIGNGYKKIAENDYIALYINESNFSIKIKNKTTQYIWNSNLENTQNERLNDEWAKFAKSSVVVYYYDKDFNKKQATLYDKNVSIAFSNVDNGVKSNINFKDIGISFDVYITLQDNSLYFEIPDKSIEDSNRILASIELLPFLGAVKNGQNNGYMFIPDGSGALVRFTNLSKGIDEPYVARVYGKDDAITESPNDINNFIGNSIVDTAPKEVHIPVYGMVHNVKQDGYLAIIESGAEYANIICYPAGVSTDFNWVTAEYIYRDKYFQPISRNMDGFLTYQKNRNKFDIKLKIALLSNNDADYVGMAKEYQKDLIVRGLLSDNIISNKSKDIPMRIELFGGEVKRGILWNSIVGMTTVNQAEYILNDLRRSGISNFLAIYKGITKGGFTGTLPQQFPFDGRLGSYDDFKKFFSENNLKNSQIAAFTDFSTAFKGAGGYNQRTDIAYKIDNRPIQFQKTKDLKDYFYLSPVAALKKFSTDKQDFEKYNISSIAVNTTPSALFSDFLDSRNVSRSKSISIYKKLFEDMHKSFASVSLYQPNDYLFKYANNYLDIPMYASQYIYETDTVPFIQIALRGYVDYYASFSNYYSDINEETLRMIEYGSYPSFLLTYKPSYMLMDTPSKNIISSQYSELKEILIKQYNEVNNALKYVKGAKIFSREVLDEKVVKVDYSNGISIIVNYTDKNYSYKGMTVKAKNYIVLGGD